MQMSSSPSSLTTAVPLYDLRQKVYALLNGTFHAAVVLDIGLNLKLNNDNLDEDDWNDVNINNYNMKSNNESGSQSDYDAFLYYVRFVEQDSRMDRWLSANQLKERYQSRQQQQQQQQ